MPRKIVKTKPLSRLHSDASSADVIQVPTFARLDEYAGVWAMESQAFALQWQKLRGLDLAAHVQQPAAPLRSAVERVNSKSGRQVAVVKLMGTLMKQQSSFGTSTSTVQARRDIRQAAADPDVVAILLAIDSPGGTVAGTDDLAKDIRQANKQKPVYAQIDDLGASAAYWLASQAEAIFANSPTALVGSIGTLMTVYDLSGAAEKEGVRAMVFATGPLKGAGVAGSKVTEDQANYFQGLVEEAQKSFDGAVQKARSLTDRQLADVRSGAVFGAAEALDRKLIDGIQSLETTIEALVAEAKARNQGAKSSVLKGTTMANELDTEACATITLTEVERKTISEQAVAATRAGAATELQRQADIRAVCDGKHPDIEAKAIAEGWEKLKAKEAVLDAKLEAVRNARPSGPAILSRSHEKDCTVDTLAAAMILRIGGRLDHTAYESSAAFGMVGIDARDRNVGIPSWLRAGLNDDQRQRTMEMAHRFSRLSAHDICLEALRIDGKDIPDTKEGVLRAASSGSALTNIFTTSVNALLLMSYIDTPDSTADWTQPADVNDFKTNERIQIEIGAGLKKLPRGGAADHAKYTDRKESYKIARYAKQFVVDEQDWIDDNLGGLSKSPREFGMAAARLRPDLVYAIILDNANLDATARALFNTTDANLETAAALAAATLRTAVKNQLLVRENSINLNLVPTHLLLPPSLKHLGWELTNSSTIFLAGTTNTERGSLNALKADGIMPVFEARLENGVTDPSDETTAAGSATAWYLVSNRANTIEVGYRRGTGRAPQVRSFVLDKGSWGMGWDVAMDIGAKALDWRGLRKNAGA